MTSVETAPHNEILLGHLMGRAFAGLGRSVQQLHSIRHAGFWRGSCEIQRGQSLIARLVCWFFGFPPAGDHPATSVTILRDRGGEIWVRRFGTDEIMTRLLPTNGGSQIVRENFGLVEFDLACTADAGGLRMRVAGMRFLGLPLPKPFWPFLDAIESHESGRFAFNIRIELPWREPLIHYMGWVDAEGTARSRHI